MKRILSIILLFSLTILTLFSCGEKADGNENSVNQTTVAGDNGAQNATEEEILRPDLPEDMNFNGYQFRILYRGPEAGVWEARDVYAEAEESADAIKDAVYRRNKTLEEKYGFEIVGIPSASGSAEASAVRKVINSGTDAYDAMVLQQGQIGTLMTSQSLLDLNELNYIDFEKPWWDQTIMNDLSIANKYFAGMGDMLITSNFSLRILLFNKTMLQSYSLESPYTLVLENKWTLDKFNEMLKTVSNDENGDGIFDENDKYGYLVQTGITSNMYYACDENVTKKDENDLPIITVSTPRSLAVLEKITNMLSNKNYVMFDSDYTHINSSPEHVIREVFEADRGLFFAEVLQLAERMRATEVNFGILPMPKYDESQTDYFTFADSWCMNLVTVPVTVAGNQEILNRTGFILEAMAAESKYTTTPAFYEKTLKGKLTRDNDSSDMLDILIKHKRVSLDETYGWGLHSALQETLKKLDNTFASAFERQTAATQTKINKLVESLTQ